MKSLKLHLVTALTVVVLLLLALVAFAIPTVYAEGETGDDIAATNAEIKSFVQELCQLNGQGDKNAVRNFIKESFQSAIGEDSATPDNQSKVSFLPFGANGNP